MSTSIATLNVNDGRWRLKARVSSISNRRSWANERSEGSLFSVVLADAEGSTIRGTFFREAVDKFYDQMQVGNVYTFSGGRLKNQNPSTTRAGPNWRLSLMFIQIFGWTIQ
jgi:replication factor A1